MFENRIKKLYLELYPQLGKPETKILITKPQTLRRMRQLQDGHIVMKSLLWLTEL